MRCHAFGLCSLILSLLPAAALAAPPALSNYVGKDPREKIRGVAFLHHPTVLAGVRRAVPAGAVQTWVLSDDSTFAPIAPLARIIHPLPMTVGELPGPSDTLSNGLRRDPAIRE
jgi:hypothetical protein